MIRIHVLARSLAATAVAGIALIGFSGVAGATTLSVSVPGLLDGGGTSHPVVTIGTGTPTNPPAPGTDASVPANAGVHVHPSASSLPVPDPTGQGSQLAQMGATDVDVDACIAATLLSGDDPQSCLGAIDGSNPIVGQLSGLEDAGTLPRALADVGGCVEARQAAGAPIDTCTSSIPTGALPTGPLPTGSLPTGALPTGALPTGGIGDLSILGSVPSAGAFDPATVTKALSTSGLCNLADQVGISAVLSCSDAASAPSAPLGSAGTPLSASSMCLGLAAVMHVDNAGCGTAAAAASPAARAHARMKARHDGGATAAGAGTSAARGTSAAAGTSAAGGTSSGVGTSARMTGSCVANVGATSPSAPFSPVTAGGFAGAGLGLAALGKALRRLRRPATASPVPDSV